MCAHDCGSVYSSMRTHEGITCACVQLWICMYTCVSMSVYTHVNVYAWTCVYMYVCVLERKCMYSYVMCAHLCIWNMCVNLYV